MNIYGKEEKLSYIAPEIEVIGIRSDVITASGGNGDGDWGLGQLPA